MRFLKSPLVIVFSLLAGIFFGILADRSLIVMVGFLGGLYLKFVQMTVIPVLISAVISSVAKLIRYPNLKSILSRMLAVFMILLLSYSVFGMLLSMTVQSGKIDVKQEALLGEIIKQSKTKTDLELSLSDLEDNEDEGTFTRFLSILVPSNIFQSLADGRTLELVFFAIVFGMALGFGKGRQSDFLISFVTNFFLTFQKIIDWVMLFLPFGLFCLIAKQVSDVGIDILISMIRFLMTFISAAVFLFCLNTIIVWSRTPYSLWYTFKSLLQPLIIAITTRSSLASIPARIESLSEHLRFDRITANLSIPMGITLCRYGNLLYFAIAGIFVAQVYDVSLSGVDLLVYPITVMLAALATSGSTGFATLSVLGIVLAPLGLPLEAILVVFYAVDPLVDPFRSALIVHTNIASTALLAQRYDGYRQAPNNGLVSDDDSDSDDDESDSEQAMRVRRNLYEMKKKSGNEE